MSHCIQYDYCIKHASTKRVKLPHVELIYLYKTASSVAKNIHSFLHRYIEMSFSVLIFFEAMTQMIFVIPLKLHVYIRIISTNYDAQFNFDPDAENRNKIHWLVFEK